MGERTALAIMGVFFMGVFFFAIVYTPVAFILFRNVALSGAKRMLFCLSAGPLFVVFMLVNLWLVSRLEPSLLELARASSLAAFVISVPLALLTTYLWYRALRAFDPLALPAAEADAPSAETPSSPAMFSRLARDEARYRSLEHFAWKNPGAITLVLIGTCVVIAIFTLPAGDAAARSERLYAFGAKVNEEIAAGAWWRLVAAAFLHANWQHLIFNCYALFVAGSFVEKVYGKARLFVLFVLAAISGSVASYFFVKSPSVGASGAIFGLMGASMVAFWRGERGTVDALGTKQLLVLGLWVLQNLFDGFQPKSDIDNAAHLGGLAGGMFVAAVLPAGAPARLVAAACAAALGWAASSVWASLEQLPRLEHFRRGLEATKTGDVETAEREYTAAAPYPPALVNRATIRMRKHRAADALADVDAAIAGSRDKEVLEIARLNRAAALFDLERYGESAAQAEAMFGSSEGLRRQRAHFIRGRALAAQARSLDALPELEAASASEDKGLAADAERMAGSILSKAHRYSEAAIAFRKAAAVSEHPADKWRMAADEHAKAGEDEKAVEAAMRAVRAPGADASTVYLAGRLLQFYGRRPETLEALEKAVALDPQNAEYKDKLTQWKHAKTSPPRPSTAPSRMKLAESLVLPAPLAGERARTLVDRNMPWQSCLDEALRHDGMSGTFHVVLTLAPTGRLVRWKVEAPPNSKPPNLSGLANCVRQTIRQIAFPAFSGEYLDVDIPVGPVAGK